MISQIDGTPFDWFGDGRMYILHLSVDGATTEVLAGWFMPTECQSGYCHMMRLEIEKNGIAVPARCRSGECGFCHSLLISGKVYIPKSVDGRRLADYKYGYIHPCVSFPLSDLEIEVPADK